MKNEKKRPKFPKIIDLRGAEDLFPSYEQTVYVVCDANGICQGVFLKEQDANSIATQTTAYVSKHKIVA